MNELYKHIQYVLVLKVDVMHYEPLLVVGFKEFKCMCMSYLYYEQITVMDWNIWIFWWISKFVPISWCIVYSCF
jgi:hypothetical protein